MTSGIKAVLAVKAIGDVALTIIERTHTGGFSPSLRRLRALDTLYVATPHAPETWDDSGNAGQIVFAMRDNDKQGIALSDLNRGLYCALTQLQHENLVVDLVFDEPDKMLHFVATAIYAPGGTPDEYIWSE